MPEEDNTTVSAPIVPKGVDTGGGFHATHRAGYGDGGLKVVANLAARDAIRPERRTEAQVVKVLGDGSGDYYFLPAGGTNLDWALEPLLGGGGGGTIGVPTLGSYDPFGVLQLTPATTIADFAQDTDTFLTATAPDQPGNLDGQALIVTGTVEFSAKLPTGLGPAFGAYTPGATISNLVLDGVYALATPNMSTRFFGGLDAGPGGDVTHVLDGIDGDVRDLDAGVGITGMLEVTDVSVYNAIYRKANARINAVQGEGEQTHAIRSDDAGITLTRALVRDDVNTAPAFSVGVAEVVSTELLRPLSGIDYFREGTIIDVSYTAASGIFEKAYHPTAVSTVTIPGAPVTDVNPSGTPAVLDPFAPTPQLTLVAGAVAVLTASVDVTIRKPNGSSAMSSNPLARGINTYSTGGSTATLDIFVDELERLQLGTATPFVSGGALSNGNAQVQNGQLVHGADGDYAGHVADAVYERMISKVSASNGIIRTLGTTAAQISVFGAGQLNILLQLETDGVWFDLGLDFGLNNGDGTGSSPANSRGAKISSSGADLSFSFGLLSTGANNNEYRLRIVFVGANGLAMTSVQGL
jgi:hypothetical protein